MKSLTDQLIARVHVMLDLETMSTAPDAAIVQVGACAFWLDEHLSAPRLTFERTVSLASSLLFGGRIDAGTVEWWRSPERDPKSRVAIECNGERLGVVLNAFTSWFTEFGPREDVLLWANGSNFDPPVLESAYRAIGWEVPWLYRNVRDARTLWEVARLFAGWERPQREVAHTALADALAQAGDVRSAWEALAERTGRTT